MKFLVVVIGVVIAAGAGVWAGRGVVDRPPSDPGVEANARLTGYAAVALLIPLGSEVVTGIRPGLLAHALIGFLLVPLVALKLGSVGYRFARYYTGDPRYRAAGPPEIVMRLLAPVLALLTVVLFATGIELWLFGFRFGSQWLAWHKAAFILWMLAITVHVFAYLRRTPELAVADSHDRVRGVLARRSVVVASLLLGAVLLVAMLPFSSPFPPPTGG